MSTVARLTAFVVALGAAFAVAALAGDAFGPAVDPERESANAPRAPAPAHGDERSSAGHGDERDAPEPVKGLSVTTEGYTLDLLERRLPLDRRTRLSFRILSEARSPVRRYAVEHERRMHLIVVRRDASQFQHLHPRLGRDGTWRVPIRLEEPGSYRVFADFKTAGRALTLGADLAVDGPVRHRALPAQSDAAVTPTGYEVRLDARDTRAGEPATLGFTVLRDGRVVHTEPYLGAGGHLVALREGDLAYLHTHPAEGGHEGASGGAHGESADAAHDDAVPFETEFPSAARYRLYFQFRAAGRVHTAAFTRRVER